MHAIALIAMQMALSAPGAKTEALGKGWELRSTSDVCFVEDTNKHSTGTYFAIMAHPDGESTIVLTNPAWRSLKEGREKVSIRFARVLSKGPLPESVEAEAVTAQLSTTSGLTGMLGLPIDRVSLDRLTALTSVHLRMGIFRGETMLTDWLFVSPFVYQRLRACIDDPFAK